MGIFLFIFGLVAGLASGLAFGYFKARDTKKLTDQLAAQKAEETERLMAQMKESFSALSLEVLSKSTDDFFKIAEQKLGQQKESNTKEMDNKKSLIDQTLQAMKSELGKVTNLVQSVEKDRKAKFDVLSSDLTKAAAETQKLRQTTNNLQSALANSRVRGQWGERMAEDVLRLAGFVEGINYQKQATIKNTEGTKSRPDFTFYMPQDRVVHMDVKFPLENYMLWLDSDTPIEKEKHLKQFLKDTRDRVKETSTRAYTGHETLDYVLVFIPNEQVYSFIHEHDRSLLDDALKQKVILCSPMTLYAILAVIRQAVDNFHLERTAGEILDLLAIFHQQWDVFCGAMDKLGDKISGTQKEFEKLTTTRKNMLEKPLRRIEALRDTDKKFDEKPLLKVVQNDGLIERQQGE